MHYEMIEKVKELYRKGQYEEASAKELKNLDSLEAMCSACLWIIKEEHVKIKLEKSENM